MNWQPRECAPGDMIRVKLGSIYHYGVFVSEDEVIQFGLPPMPEFAHEPNAYTVCATSIDVFACGNIVEAAQLDRKERRGRIPPAETIRLARSRLGEGGYDIIHNNCEHFASECVLGVRRSEQVDSIRRRWRSSGIAPVR